MNRRLHTAGAVGGLCAAKDSAGSIRRRVAALAVLAALALAGGLLGQRLLGQIDHLRGVRLLEQGLSSVAAVRLEQAARRLPGDAQLHLNLGEAYYRISGAVKAPRLAFLFARKAADQWTRAAALHPLDSLAVHRLAVATAWLERLQAHLYPDDPNPYEPLALFEAAIRLRPNAVTARLDLARLCHRRGRSDDLARLAGEMGRIYPESFYSLRQEPFWTTTLAETFQNGVRQALAQSHAPRQGNMVLASLCAAAGRWTEAADRYRAGMEASRFKNTSRHYLALGAYCLHAGRFAPAAESFTTALSLSDNRPALLEAIYQSYRRAEALRMALPFFGQQTEAGRADPTAAILLARSHLDLAQPQRARRVLEQTLARRPTAEGFYWRAIVAREEQDWDAMELAAQRATVLDPRHSRAYGLLAAALERQLKWVAAEAAATQALRHTANPDSWLHHQRARIRWARGNVAGAARDWQEAVRLHPAQATFYAHLAEALARLGDRQGFERNYRLAIERDPQNIAYRKRLATTDARFSSGRPGQPFAAGVNH